MRPNPFMLRKAKSLLLRKGLWNMKLPLAGKVRPGSFTKSNYIFIFS